MDNPTMQAPDGNQELTKAKKEKEKKKHKKKEVSLYKIELALYRAQMAMVRTAATMTTFGFALYKLLEERANDGKERPVLHVITPRSIAVALFLAGFVGLVTYSIKHVHTLKKLELFKPSFYWSGIMIITYILMVLTLGLLIGVMANG